MHASNPAREHSESEPLAQGFGRPTPDGTLWCEGVSLEEIARRFGTPTYVYSKAMIESRFDAYDLMGRLRLLFGKVSIFRRSEVSK